MIVAVNAVSLKPASLDCLLFDCYFRNKEMRGTRSSTRYAHASSIGLSNLANADKLQSIAGNVPTPCLWPTGTRSESRISKDMIPGFGGVLCALSSNVSHADKLWYNNSSTIQV